MKGLNIYELNVFNILCFMYKCKYNLCPPIFKELYKQKPRNKYQLRRNDPVYEPLCRPNLDKFCIAFRGPSLWNKIVLDNFDFSDNPSFLSFKVELKEIIFSLENIMCYF